MRARAPQATVLLIQYLPALAADAATCPALPMRPAQAVAARHIYDGLITATRQAAQATGTETISSPNADSHGACAAEPWVTGLVNPLTPTGSAAAGSIHPNQWGTTQVAQLIIARIRD
ncbi:hypothetical protein ACIHDR_41430 [Nocardia sp. NPDC052278]|uniref:hypothetical protein n=1 Tax=unclassified Nocardia TaxID=2637762 RepID=UPI00368CC960